MMLAMLLPDCCPYVGPGRTYTHGRTEHEGIDAATIEEIKATHTRWEWWLLTSTQTEQRDASARYGVPMTYIHRQRARLIRRLREQYEEDA